MVSGIVLEANVDNVLASFTNQLGALGEGEARKAMARAVNRAGRTIRTHVIRSLGRQTSIPRAILTASVKGRAAAHKGDSAIQFVIHATGSELPLRMFNPRQFSYGVRAKVWGRAQRFPGMFGAPGDNPKVVAALGGHVFHRSGASRLPIEKGYGPSIPKEMVLAETKAVFERMAPIETEKRLRHEIARLLPG